MIRNLKLFSSLTVFSVLIIGRTAGPSVHAQHVLMYHDLVKLLDQ